MENYKWYFYFVLYIIYYFCFLSSSRTIVTLLILRKLFSWLMIAWPVIDIMHRYLQKHKQSFDVFCLFFLQISNLFTKFFENFRSLKCLKSLKAVFKIFNLLNGAKARASLSGFVRLPACRQLVAKNIQRVGAWIFYHCFLSKAKGSRTFIGTKMDPVRLIWDPWWKGALQGPSITEIDIFF